MFRRKKDRENARGVFLLTISFPVGITKEVFIEDKNFSWSLAW
jgi:hypothetical protein